MPLSKNQRIKLICLMRIMLQKTDEQHPLTVNELIAELGAYDIKAERKSIYSDLELLRQLGIDIETVRDKSTRYYVAQRLFELPELKLLVDAVQSSRFITEKKSEELISKLLSLTSIGQAKHLKRPVHIAGQAKALNETVYYNIDEIHAAIKDGKQITFRYFDYDTKKKRIYRKNGEEYKTSPLALCWSDDKYYLIAYNESHDRLVHYRVDRMSDATTLDDNTIIDQNRFNISEHIRQSFGMHSGELVSATLEFDTSLVNVVLDYFGSDVRITEKSKERFEITAEVLSSSVFLAWMFQFGNRARIVAPGSLILSMQALIETNIRNYSTMSNAEDNVEQNICSQAKSVQ